MFFEPIFIKLGWVVDIDKTYHQSFRIFGAKFEFLDQKNGRIRLIFVFMAKKIINFSAFLHPIFMKFGEMVNIIEIHDQKFSF